MTIFDWSASQIASAGFFAVGLACLAWLLNLQTPIHYGGICGHAAGGPHCPLCYIAAALAGCCFVAGLAALTKTGSCGQRRPASAAFVQRA
jgi:hypothetical protein